MKSRRPSAGSTAQKIKSIAKTTRLEPIAPSKEARNAQVAPLGAAVQADHSLGSLIVRRSEHRLRGLTGS